MAYAIRKELAGLVYGRWTVISFAGISHLGHALWNCVCACGTQKIVQGRALLSGESTSCRCGRRGRRHNVKRSLFDRIDALTLREPNSGCWLWEGKLNQDGYGRTTLPGKRKGSVFVHRISYQRYVGPIPSNLEIDHLCRVRSCLNPAHLEAVPHQVNVARGLVPLSNRKRARS